MNSTLLSNKLERFLGTTLTATRQIRAEELKEFGIAVDPRMLKGVLFEHGVNLQSQAVGSHAGRVFVGAHSYMNNGGYLRSGVFIGRYCSIGRRVSLGAGMHSMVGVSTAPVLRGRGKAYTEAERTEAGIAPRRPTRIPHALTILENDVWVGDGAIILPGVRVGTGSIIGANSVVTHDVAPYSVMGGIPAKPLRTRFAPAVAEKLLQTQYWDYPLAFIQTLPCANVFEFIEAFEAGGSGALPQQIETLELA